MSNLGAGIYSFKAIATDSLGGTGTSASISEDVGVSISLGDPTNSSVFIAPADIRVRANLTGPVGSIAGVEYFAGSTSLGTSTTAPYTVVWPSVAAGTYTLTAVMTDTSGNTLASSPAPVQVISSPTVSVAAGLDGSTTTEAVLSLDGTVVAPLNSAVVVNGSAAAIDDSGHWIVNSVQLAPGQNTISIAVNTIEASVVAQTISVTRTGSSDFAFSVSPQSGFAPFAPVVTLTSNGSAQVGRVEFDFDGDGITDSTVTDFSGSYSATLNVNQPTTVGIGVKVYDTQNGLVYSGTRWLQAQDPSLVGYRALSVVNGMLDELSLGNATAALRFFTGDARATYQGVFDRLGSTLPQVAQQLGVLKQGSFGDGSAEFVLLRDTADGPRAFPMYVYKGTDGVWRLESM
jgi:hypothetical protein